MRLISSNDTRSQRDPRSRSRGAERVKDTGAPPVFAVHRFVDAEDQQLFGEARRFGGV